MLEDRDNVRETFVEGRDIAVARLDEKLAQPVNERMCHLVSDDVMREAGEDGLARQVRPWVLPIRAEIAEQ